MIPKRYGRRWRFFQSSNIEIALRFEPRDLWIGVYWDRNNGIMFDFLAVYLCLIPLFPIEFMFDVSKLVRRG